MNNKNSYYGDTSDREIITSKIYNISRDELFSMFSDSAHLDKWWGPDGFETNTSEIDFRPGGYWKYKMKGPDGKIFPNLIKYQEIIPSKKIRYLHSSGEDDNDQEFMTTINFEDHENGTEVLIRMVFENEEDYKKSIDFGAKVGLKQTLNNLKKYLELR